MPKFSKINLKDIEDSAAKFGYTDNHEARFPSKLMNLEQAGFSLQRLKPNKRSMFGHRHKIQEEILVVLAGSGRIKLDDEVIELQPYDAIRIPPGVMQACAADDEGLEYLVFGAPKTEERDWEMVSDWWTD